MTGAGPSRRSHTKSRTGCKTCKRRHIRCDETVPQCRNCTKHQVRCDYMDDSPADSTVPSPRSSSDFTNRSTDADLAAWRQSGAFPFPALLVERPPSPDTLSDTELRLIHHLCSVCNDLRQAGTSSLTIWTERIPKFLSLASGHSFLMQALCSFSATHLAWKESSAEFRNLQTEHGGVALRGLHDAIGAFSQENADAIVAASMLMNWQATDWLSWSSLSAGSYTVMGAMTPWARSQFLAEHFPREGLTTATFRPPTSVKVISVAERAQILGNVVEALQAVRLGLRGQDMEAYWMDQLLAYVERLQHTNPAQSPEEQFEHAYILRKWAFWVPISMLQRQDAPQGQVTIVLAHLYATIVALEPVFPNLLSLFQTVMIMPPLETIIDLTEAMSRHQDGSASAEISAVMHFARQTAYEHRFIRSRQNSGMSSQGDGSEQNLSVSDFSPAFVPSTPAELQVQSEITRHLNVPISNTGFTYGVSTWGMAPSPGFPPQDFGVDFLGTSSPDMLDSQSGFVNTIPIWV